MSSSIFIKNGSFDCFKFPGGEMHVRINEFPKTEPIIVRANLKTSDDIMTLLLLTDALRRMHRSLDYLYISQVPYARQDRVCNPGEALSIKVMADLINSIGAKEVIIYDPHSDVTPALINNVLVIPQWDLVPKDLLKGRMVICPDAGAEKKIHKLGVPYILCTKDRDPLTGEIKRTIVHHHGSLEGCDCLIIDDICDGGRTFLEIAKVLKSKNAGKIELYVTHGIFSKGPDVFRGLIDQVYYRNGQELLTLL